MVRVRGDFLGGAYECIDLYQTNAVIFSRPARDGINSARNVQARQKVRFMCMCYIQVISASQNLLQIFVHIKSSEM